MDQQIDKPSYNEEFRICDFTSILGTDTILTGIVTITDELGVDSSDTMISDVTVPTDGKAVRYKLKGGMVGSKYRLLVKVITAGTQKFVEPFIVYIK